MRCDNLLSTAIFFATLAVTAVFGQQFTQIDLSHGPFELDNRFVHVLRISIPPHGIASLKASSVEGIAVSLREGVLKITSDKGTSEQWTTNAGSVFRLQADTAYSLTNQNDVAVELQVAELLGSRRIDQLRVPHTSYDPVNVDPRHFQTIFENEQLRVLRVSIQPSAETEDVQFSAGPLITLQDSYSTSTGRDGKVRDDHRGAGSVSWEQSGLHSIKNAGDKPIDSLLLELKRPFCYELNEGMGPDELDFYGKAYWKADQLWSSFMFFHQPYESKGLIRVAFKLQPNGKLTDDGVTVLTAFANDSMVEAAISAVRKAAPYPPLPRAIKEGLTWTFLANLPKDPPGCN